MSLLKMLGGLLKGKKSAKRAAAKPKRNPLRKTSKKTAKKSPKKPVRKALKKPQKKIQKKVFKKAAPKQKPAEKPIGIVTHYFGKISVGIIKLKSDLKVGETIRFQGAHDEFAQTVGSMQIHHKDVAHAKKGAEIGIKVSRRVHENSRVYRAL